MCLFHKIFEPIGNLQTTIYWKGKSKHIYTKKLFGLRRHTDVLFLLCSFSPHAEQVIRPLYFTPVNRSPTTLAATNRSPTKTFTTNRSSTKTFNHQQVTSLSLSSPTLPESSSYCVRCKGKRKNKNKLLEKEYQNTEYKRHNKYTFFVKSAMIRVPPVAS